MDELTSHTKHLKVFHLSLNLFVKDKRLQRVCSSERDFTASFHGDSLFTCDTGEHVMVECPSVSSYDDDENSWDEKLKFSP